jgi:hypothetical protein
MEKVYVQITAFDKNSADNIGRSIVANSKENFNEQVEEFESTVLPFRRLFALSLIARPIVIKVLIIYYKN